MLSFNPYITDTIPLTNRQRLAIWLTKSSQPYFFQAFKKLEKHNGKQKKHSNKNIRALKIHKRLGNNVRCNQANRS